MEKGTSGFRSLFYHNPLSSWVYELNTFKILDVNKAALKQYGYTKEEFLSLTIKDFSPKEEISQLLDAHQNIQNQEENIFFGIFTHQTKSGELIRMEVNGYKANFQNLECVLAVCQDVPLIVKQISEAEQMMDASLDVFCTVNEQGNFVYVSAAALNHWGYLPEELIGKSFQDLILEEDVPKTNEIIAAILRGQEIKSFTNRYKKKNGDIAYNLWSARWDDRTKLRYAVAKDCKEKIEQEEIILQSEQRFKALVQEASDLIAIIDEKGNYKYVSPTSTSIFGISPQEFIGRNALEFIHPNDVERTLASLQKIATENRVMVEPFRFQNQEKEWRWVETVLTNMFDNPTVNGIVANSRDITETVKSRKQTEASELFNRTVLESSLDCLKVLDIEGRIQFMNFNGLCQMEIDDFSTFENKNWGTLWGSENEALVKASIDKTLKGETAQFTAFLPTAKGTPKWWDVLVSPVCKPGEPVHQIISVSRDITKQKEEEQRLKLLESVITNTNDAILITEAESFDEQGPRILFVNEAFTKMTGYAAEEVIGKTPRMMQGPNSNKEELVKLGSSIRNWKPYEITTINYKKSGEEFWVNFTVTPVADEKGGYTHWIAIERDVTEQKIKELEKELIAQISVNFSNENDFISATNQLCKSISKFGKFDLVEVWIANREKSLMQLFSHYIAEPADEIFYDYSPEVDTFKISQSLVGKVWSQRVQLLWDDIENHNDFARRDAVKKIGLNAVLGIPLIFNGEAIGVLSIGTKHGVNYLNKYAQIFKRLEGFIGSEFNRKKLENDLSHLFNAIPDILCLIGIDGRFLKINKAGCDLMGYSEEDVLYHGFEKFVHPQDKGIFTNEVMNLEKENTTFIFENRYLTKGGDIIWLSWYCNATLKEGIIYATAKNITEEKKLRELNCQVRSMAKIGSWEVDLVNQSVFWSKEIHQMHETDSKSFVPNLESSINFYREDFRQMVQINIEKSIATGEPFDFEAVLVTGTKKELWVRSIGKAEFADGVCIRFYGSYQDINDRKESENRLSSLSENLPGVVCQYLTHPDRADSLSYVSGGIEEMLGFTDKEVMENVNLVWNQIKAGGDFEEVQASILKSIRTKSKWRSRFKYVMPSGELRTHIGNGNPIFLADGTILYNLMILDITQEVKNEELLKQTSEMARIGSWELDLLNQVGDSMYWSPMVREILELDAGYNPTLEGGLKFYIGGNKEKVQQAVTNLISEGLEFDEEILLLTGKGHERWIRIIGKSETANNKRTKIYGSLQDIDERKKSEIKLAESENRFRTILEAEPECIKLLGPGGELLMMNPAGLAMIEADNEEQVLGKSVLGILLPEHRSAFLKLKKNVFKGESAKLIFEIKGLKGTRRWLETHTVPLKNQNGEIISLLGITRDITERKNAEEIILQANERFEKVTEATNDAIWDWDIVNQTYHRSKAIERFFGKETSKSYTNNDFWKEHFHPEDLGKIQGSIYEAFDNPSRTRWELEYRVLNEQGKILYVIDRGVIIRNNDGKAIRMVGAMTDISEQKQMTLQLKELNQSLQQYASELERSNEELEQFAYVASHDLQEPLRMISSFMDQLKRKYGDQLDEKAHQYIHFATDGAKRMKQIILNVLEYSRASRQTEGKEEVDMNEILSEFKQLRRKLISEKKATIKSAYLPTLYTYKAAITQILNCILDNALKYTEAGTPPIVAIMVVENENEWEFSIKDNGIGIDPQFYDKIFIIFQRLHNKDQFTGTGIGLSIAKRHVDFLGGRIWLKSMPGEGTVFYFTIPKIKNYE